MLGAAGELGSHHKAPVLLVSGSENNPDSGVFWDESCISGDEDSQWPLSAGGLLPLCLPHRLPHSLPCLVLSTLFWVAQDSPVINDEVLKSANFKLSAALG